MLNDSGPDGVCVRDVRGLGKTCRLSQADLRDQHFFFRSISVRIRIVKLCRPQRGSSEAPLQSAPVADAFASIRTRAEFLHCSGTFPPKHLFPSS